MKIVIDKPGMGEVNSTVRQFFVHYPGPPKTCGIDRGAKYLRLKNLRSIRPLIAELQIPEVQHSSKIMVFLCFFYEICDF